MAKKTEIEKEFTAEMAKIRRRYRSFISRGYIDVKGLLTNTLGQFSYDRPEKITKRELNKLNKYTTEWFYKNFKYKTSTGKIVSGTKGREIARSEAAQKAAETRKKKSEEYDEAKAYENYKRSELEDFSIYTDVYNAIESIPDELYAGRGRKIDYTWLKKRLKNEVIKNEYSVTNKMAYAEHLFNNWAVIQSQCDVMYLATSDNPAVQEAKTTLINIICGRIITAKEAKDYEAINPQ